MKEMLLQRELRKKVQIIDLKTQINVLSAAARGEKL